MQILYDSTTRTSTKNGRYDTRDGRLFARGESLMVDRRTCLWCDKSNASGPHEKCESIMENHAEEANMISEITMEVN